MMNPEDIEQMLSKTFPSAAVAVDDMTGTQDHFEIRMSWEGFRGKSLMEQHKIVHQALEGPLEDGRIHAIKIKTVAPK